MNGWVPTNLEIVQTVSGVTTGTAASKEFAITAGGSKFLVVKIDASAVTVGGSITAKLQTAIGSDWVDSKSVTISATGIFYIKLNNEVAADQTYLPLLSKGRIVIVNTNAGDTVTLAANSINVLQEL